MASSPSPTSEYGKDDLCECGCIDCDETYCDCDCIHCEKCS